VPQVPPITVSARTGAPEETSADTRVIGLFDGDSLPEGPLRGLSDSGEASGKLRKLAVTHEDGGRRVIVAGLGKRDSFDAEAARVAAAVAAGRARELSAKSLSWAAPSGSDEGVAGALVEGTLLALYKFDRFKSSSDDDEAAGGIESLEIASSEDDVAAAVERARVVAEAANAARDLQNLPSNVATPAFLASRGKEIAATSDKLTSEALGPDEIRELKMGAFLAVAQGSDVEPRLIVLRYDGGGDGPHLGFVGKAVTFDTGGISIKPAAKMQDMKFDMSGGAAVLEAMGAIAALELPLRVTAVVPATENMPSGHSMKPGDIVTASNGTTIEVNNTDAEGRLILADALVYALAQGAERLVDLATLTGAIVVALGSTYSGLFSNDDEWCGEVEAASTATGELGWRMPLHPEYLELTKGVYADLTNASDVRKAGSCYAAQFLGQFVDEKPWVHVDIAGTAWDQRRAYNGAGASGFGVRMLVELATRAASDRGA
jgi:leucyl aminopeptidase